MKPAVWVCAALLLAGCESLEPKLPRRPADLPQVKGTFGHELVAKRRVDGLTVRVYDTGSAVVKGGAVSSIKSWRAKTRLAVPVFLIRHPLQGLILFDTGLHPDTAYEPPQERERLRDFLQPFRGGLGLDAVSQLKADGVDPAAVRWVIVSHLHSDHAGMISAFPQAEILVDDREWLAQRELQAVRPNPHELDPAKLDPSLKIRLVDLSTAPAFGAFDHGRDLFGDGTLFLLDLSGHSPGTLGLWVNLDEGPVLLASDSTWILDHHQDLALPVRDFIYDLPRFARRLYQLKEMQEALPRLVIFPGHDLAPLRLQPRQAVTLAAPRR